MSNYLVHSSREWKSHKYIRKEGDRYIYEEPRLKARSVNITGQGKPIYRRESTGAREQLVKQLQKTLSGKPLYFEKTARNFADFISNRIYTKHEGFEMYESPSSYFHSNYNALDLIRDSFHTGFLDQDEYDALINLYRTDDKFFNDVMEPYVKEAKKEAASFTERINEHSQTVSHDDLMHYGTPRHSGRYEWGSGDRPFQGDENMSSAEIKAEMKRLDKADRQFIRKNEKKIKKAAEKVVKPYMNKYDRELRKVYATRTSRGKLAKNYATAYSKKLAELMNTAIGDIPTNTGSDRVVKFVALRGEIGVQMVAANPDYNMRLLKNGIYSDSGRVAYKKDVLDGGED